MSAEPMTPGFYGKVASRGDFVSRNLPRGFIDPWDQWLQAALAESRQALGEGDWLQAYLTSPVWRFALSSGNCGEQPYTGVLMPSVDRVGRYFPLTLAVALPRDSDLLSLTGALAWYGRIEQLVFDGLDDHLDLDEFTSKVESLGEPPARASAPRPQGDGIDERLWHCTVDDFADRQAISDGLSSHWLAQQFPRLSLWWTQGSEQIAACLLLSPGLPPAAGFAALLSGDWQRWGWGEKPLTGYRTMAKNNSTTATPEE